MFDWFLQKRMVGGLVFGPPAWMPERIEETFEPVAGTIAVPATSGIKAEPVAPQAVVRSAGEESPSNRTNFVGLLRRIRLPRTCNLVPAVIDQLREAGDKPIRTLVLNGLPTQPEFALSAALTRLALEDVHRGLRAIESGTGANRTLVALDRHDLRSFQLWRRILRANKPQKGRRPRIRMLLNRYPQADPTMLVRKLFGGRLAAGALPTQAGRMIVDPVSCWAIGRFLRTGQAFTERPLQIFMQADSKEAASPSSSEPQEPRLVMGRIGERMTEFCKRHRVDFQNKQVILNGMLTGREVDPEATRIDATTESIAFREPAPAEKATACLACGWCVDVCPTGLTPVHLMQLSQNLDAVPEKSTEVPAILRSTAARESLHCIGCGLCTYVCPTRLPLMAATLHLRSRVSAAMHSAANEVHADEA
ncbi:MAG TPA: 4Fe-4S dicluster domain-containing protein [Phycisphaerae bacterium]|jgi:electron transport complex protein RnfC